MVNVRLYPGSEPGGQSAGIGGARLNLLLSYAGWQPDPLISRLPTLLQPMGIRSLTASTGREASNVIQSNRVHIALVDLALPLEKAGSADSAPEFAEGGPRLLELLARLDEPPPVVAVKRSRSARDDARDIAAALRLGAFAVVDRPETSGDLNMILDVLRRCLARFYKGRWPGIA